MKDGSRLRAVIYARVSTKEQAEGKISIPKQIADCKKTIIENNWELVHEPYLDEGISGHLLEERLGLQKLLADARQHQFDLVVVKDFDRFARNRAAATIVREELKELFIQTYALNTPVAPKDPRTYDPTDDDLAIMVEGFSDANSEIERNKIRRRMMEGKNAIAKAGKIPNNVPYGYKIERWFNENGKPQRRVVVNEEHAKVIRNIFQLYIGGKGARAIAQELNRAGIKSPNGTLWQAQAVKYILQNETYTGKVRWGWRHADYKKNQQRKIRNHQGIIAESKEHEAIISEETFRLAQREKSIRGNTQKGRAQLSRGVLTGIAKCIRCGSGVTYLTRHHKRSKINPRWKDTITYEYLCGGYKYSGQCQRRVMSAEKLEGFVIGQIKNILNNPNAKQRLIFDRDAKLDEDLTDEYQTARKGLEQLAGKLKRQQEAYEAGVSSLEEYRVALDRLREEESRYRAVTDSYEINHGKIKEREKELNKFLGELKNFETLWNESNLQEKKHFLRMIIKEIRAGNGNVEIDFRF